MSGGSFNYLCFADHFGNHKEELQEMAEELKALGYHDLYQETLSYMPNEPPQGLREVWRAVEWWRSNDYSIGQAAIAAEEYKKKSR